jgi:hypothetical protein
MKATSRNGAAAKGSASLSSQNEGKGREQDAELRYVNRPTGWLRTGANRLEPIPMSLREWAGPENRSKFGENSKRLHAVGGGKR